MKTTIRLITTSLFGLALMAYGQDNNASVPTVQAVPHTADNSKDAVDVSPATTFDPHLGGVTSTAAFVGSSVLQRKVVDVFSPNSISVPLALLPFLVSHGKPPPFLARFSTIRLLARWSAPVATLSEFVSNGSINRPAGAKIYDLISSFFPHSTK